MAYGRVAVAMRVGVSVCSAFVMIFLVIFPQQAMAQDSELPAQAQRDIYRLGPGDVLRVEAFQHSEISGEFQVEDGGDITFPLLGRVAVAGLSVPDVARVLEQRLEKDFYVDVQLQAEVKEYRSKPVTLMGEVQRPGTYYLRGRTSLTQLLAEAGGMRSTAGPEVELLRIEMVDGKGVQSIQTYSARNLLSGGEGSDVVLRAGDVVSVAAKQLYFISGEVARPGQYEISRGLTLMQAVSQAGGVGKFASQGVELHREGAEGKEILSFDLSRIRKGKDRDVEIHPGDVIIVKRRFF